MSIYRKRHPNVDPSQQPIPFFMRHYELEIVNGKQEISDKVIYELDELYRDYAPLVKTVLKLVEMGAEIRTGDERYGKHKA